ncbi:hypothetical protein SCOR_03420 [Sulfidibacter corallicola]
MEQLAPPIEATQATTIDHAEERSETCPSWPCTEVARSPVPASRESQEASRWSSLLHQSKQRRQRQSITPRSEARRVARGPAPKPRGPQSPRRERIVVAVVGQRRLATSKHPGFAISSVHRGTQLNRVSRSLDDGFLSMLGHFDWLSRRDVSLSAEIPPADRFAGWRSGQGCALLFGVTLIRYMRYFDASAGPANLLPRRLSKHAGTPSMGRFDRFIRWAHRRC